MDPVIFGSDLEEHIISAFQINEKFIRVYKKLQDKITHEDREFYPFFFLTNDSYMEHFAKKYWVKKLNGNGYYQYVCAFTDWNELKEAYRFIIDKFKQNNDLKNFDIVLLKNDPVGQYLTQYGKTLFKGMKFDDLSRMQIDALIKPAESFEKSEIIAFYLSDTTGWEQPIDDKDSSEKEKIEKFINIIKQRNPDVIEGFQLYSNLFPLIIEKCKAYDLSFNIGRDNEEVTYIERISINEYEFEKMNLIIPGRHIVDILDLVQNYDQIKRLILQNKINDIAKAINVQKPERILLDQKINYKDHSLLRNYLKDNCFEIGKICEELLPGIFYLTQSIPYNMNRVLKLNHNHKIESILIREYLKQRQSIPAPEKVDLNLGSLSEIYYTGVVGPIVHAEIDLIAPTVMLKNEIFPLSDSLSLYKSLLNYFYTLYQSSISNPENETAEKPSNDLTNINLSLLNGFFVYIISKGSLFNSNEAAQKAVSTIKDSLNKLITIIRNSGAIPIEIDSDEIYFVPPRDVKTEEAENTYINTLSKKITDFCFIKYVNRYRRILSYKKKNYALLGYNNKIKMKGSSLISKNLERFGRQFIFQCTDLLLNYRFDDLHALYIQYYKNISERKLNVLDFQRTENLKESLHEYENDVKEGKRNRSVHYELAVLSGKNFKAGDQISFYKITDEAAAKRNKIDQAAINLVKKISDGETKELLSPFEYCENYKLAEEWNPNFPDEDINYYLKRLDEISEKFLPFFNSEDFRMIFSIDDLFAFSSVNIKIVPHEVNPEETQTGN